MGKSKKRKKKKDKGKGKTRAMRSGRMATVDRIERARSRARTTATPAAAPPKTAEPPPAIPTNPKAAPLVAKARALGLSVADDVASDTVQRLLERFELAATYAADTFGSIVGKSTEEAGVSTPRLNRVVAGLFDDGRLAERVVEAQRKREAHPGGPPPHDAAFRAVATKLRRALGECVPAAGLLSRLLGR